MIFQEINLLIVEDNAGDARLIEEKLKYSSLAKFNFMNSSTKAAAFEILRTFHADIILLDLNLPDSFGLNTFNDFNKSFPAIPIVVLTGSDNLEIGQEAAKNGAQDFLVKASFSDIILERVLYFSIERYKNKKQIIEERKRFYDVLEMLPAYVVLLTKDYYVRHSNQLFKKLYGNDEGKKCFEFVAGRNVPCDGCAAFKVFKTKTPLEREIKEANDKYYYVYDYPFIDVDGSELILEMGVDITGQKLAENEFKKLNEELEKRVQRRTMELELANKELEAFSYSVSHDLRAYLAIMQSLVKKIPENLNGNLNDAAKDHLNRLASVISRMSELLKEILKLSRISREELDLETLSLDKMADEIISIFKSEDPERDVEIFIEPEINIYADNKLLKIAMENLLNNAWKFTRYKSNAKIKVGMIKKNGESVYYVEDNGAGFNMRYYEKLFNPFQRFHDSKVFEGSGIGLATVKRIINKHGGKIWAESEQFKGTTFFFTVP